MPDFLINTILFHIILEMSTSLACFDLWYVIRIELVNRLCNDFVHKIVVTMVSKNVITDLT